MCPIWKHLVSKYWGSVCSCMWALFITLWVIESNHSKPNLFIKINKKFLIGKENFVEKPSWSFSAVLSSSSNQHWKFSCVSKVKSQTSEALLRILNDGALQDKGCEINEGKFYWDVKGCICSIPAKYKSLTKKWSKQKSGLMQLE